MVKWQMMRTLRSFAFGTFYLVSGIYSIGFGALLDLGTRGVSGNPAIVATPDFLFPFEVALFVAFGLAFIAASAFQFRSTLKHLG